VKKLERRIWRSIGLVIILIFALACFGCKADELPPEPEVTTPAVIDSFQGPQIEPQKLVIAKLDVDEEIDPVGKDSETGMMKVPPGATGISWYKVASGSFPSPGWKGNALLAGHNYYNLVPGTLKDLYTLDIGDTMEVIYKDGSKGVFTLKSKKIYDEDDAKAFEEDRVFLSSEDARVTVMTCHGDRKPGGGYPERLIVVFSPVEHVSASGEKLTVITP